MIGVTGFIGRHLSAYLLDQGEEVIGTTHRRVGRAGDKRIRMLACDVGKKQDIGRVVRSVRPETIYYLAGQSSVRRAWFDPAGTFQVNLLGAISLMETLRTVRKRIRLMVFSSSTVYGLSHKAGQALSEETCLRPKDPYALSKMCLDYVARFYAKVYGLDVVVVRLVNVVGPGQDAAFSLSNFASQIIGIELGKLKPRIEVGNIAARRDYLDVRDAVRALCALQKRGASGEAYNIASGKSRSLGDVLGRLIRLSKLGARSIQIIRRESLMSKDEIPSIQLDASKMRRLTGWRPRVPFDQTLRDILEAWRREWHQEKKAA